MNCVGDIEGIVIECEIVDERAGMMCSGRMAVPEHICVNMVDFIELKHGWSRCLRNIVYSSLSVNFLTEKLWCRS